MSVQSWNICLYLSKVACHEGLQLALFLVAQTSTHRVEVYRSHLAEQMSGCRLVKSVKSSQDLSVSGGPGTLLKTSDQNFVYDLTFLSLFGLDSEEISALRKDKRIMEQATNQTNCLKSFPRSCRHSTPLLQKMCFQDSKLAVHLVRIQLTMLECHFYHRNPCPGPLCGLFSENGRHPC